MGGTDPHVVANAGVCSTGQQHFTDLEEGGGGEMGGGEMGNLLSHE